MTDWREAGQKADAARIRNALRSQFAGEAKEIVRKEVLTYLQAVGSEKPLDLWGGGLSAEDMVAAGMHPLVIDDGRAADLVGEAIGQRVSKARFLRAMRVSGEIQGYDTRPGAIVTHASDADAAFLDFCGHWSPSVERALIACRHMKAVAVTLMPERTALGRLTVANWKTAYGALIQRATGMSLTATRVYQRNALGQRAIVFMLRPNLKGVVVPRVRERERERDSAYLARPDIRERTNARRREWRKERAERDPEWAERDRQRNIAYQREYRQRPEVRERLRRLDRERYNRPERKEQNRASRERRKEYMSLYRQTAEYKAKNAEYQRRYQARRHGLERAA